MGWKETRPLYSVLVCWSPLWWFLSTRDTLVHRGILDPQVLHSGTLWLLGSGCSSLGSGWAALSTMVDGET